MKRLFTSAFFCAICLLFVSCFEIVESVSLDNGRYKISYRITVSKTLSELGELGNAIGSYDDDYFDDYDDFDYDELFDDIDILKDPLVRRNLKRIDTEFETGFYFQVIVPTNKKHSLYDIDDLIPVKKGNTYIFSMDLFNDAHLDPEDVEEQLTSEFIKMFFGVAKYRILMSKSLMPTMTSARLVRGSRIVSEVSFYDDGDVWSVDIPMPLLFEGGMRPLQLELK